MFSVVICLRVIKIQGLLVKSQFFVPLTREKSSNYKVIHWKRTSVLPILSRLSTFFIRKTCYSQHFLLFKHFLLPIKDKTFYIRYICHLQLLLFSTSLKCWYDYLSTHYHTMPHFDALKIYSCGKHCEKRRICL